MADWNPGRTHWWGTTAIAIIGAIVGGASVDAGDRDWMNGIENYKGD